MRHVITSIEVLTPIRYMLMAVNGTNSMLKMKNDGPVNDRMIVEDHRIQRSQTVLRNVAYVITSYIECDPSVVIKFEVMYQRRIRKGQFHKSPYMGVREFPADVSMDTGGYEPIQMTKSLGLLPLQVQASPDFPLFFEATIRNGVMQVPYIKDWTPIQ
jgi:CRISPR-associated protein Cas5d